MTEPVRRELAIPNNTACLSQVRHTIVELLGPGPAPAGEVHLISLAVDEALTNIMQYAYSQGPGDGPQEIQVLLEVDEASFRAVIRDTGRHFDPTSVAEVNVGEHMRQGRRRGLGVFIMRRVMDEVTYTFRHGKYNELQMVKYLQPRAVKAQSAPVPGPEGVSHPCR